MLMAMVEMQKTINLWCPSDVSKLNINNGSDTGLLPNWRHAIIWSNAGILIIGPLGTNFSEILNEVITFSFTKMRLKMSSDKLRPFCLGLNVLTNTYPLLVLELS